MQLNEVLMLLCENKVNFIVKRYGQKMINRYKELLGADFDDPGTEYPEINLQFVKDVLLAHIIEDIDPTEKNIEWIVKQYLNRLFVLGEDDTQIKEDIESFERNKRKMQYQDINRYTLSTLRRELVRFDTSGNEGDFADELQKAIQNKDISLIEKSNGFVIYRALTKEGAIVLGKGGGHQFNRWCTARTDEHNKFEWYTEELYSDIYVVIFENGKRFQFDIEQGSHIVQNCMDELDNDLLHDESPDSSYWPIIRNSNIIQSEHKKKMKQRWAFVPWMSSWEDYVKECVKHNKSIMNSMSIILRSNKFKDFKQYNTEKMISDFSSDVLKLSDSNFVQDISGLGFLYLGHYDVIFERMIDNIILNNKKIINRIVTVFKRGPDEGYNIKEYNTFVQHLYELGTKEGNIK